MLESSMFEIFQVDRSKEFRVLFAYRLAFLHSNTDLLVNNCESSIRSKDFSMS